MVKGVIVFTLIALLGGGCSGREALESSPGSSEAMEVQSDGHAGADATQPSEERSTDISIWANALFEEGCGCMQNMIRVHLQEKFIRYVESQGYHIVCADPGGCSNHPLYRVLIITADGEDLAGQETDSSVYSFKDSKAPYRDFSFRLVYSAEPKLNEQIKRVINRAEAARTARHGE